MKIFLAIVLFVGCLGFLKYNEVQNFITDEDKKYIKKILHENSLSLPGSNPTYKEELNFIMAVQDAVLQISPKFDGIPEGQPREVKNLYNFKSGLCYDRSRTIEKILRFSKFKTRHISIFSAKDTSPRLLSLGKRKVSSHAITEVLTSRGWLVVDSNRKWVSVDARFRPYSIEQVRPTGRGGEVDWLMATPPSNYNEDFLIVYGLYSRHGRFFPPYNRIPDIVYSELVQNFF